MDKQIKKLDLNVIIGYQPCTFAYKVLNYTVFLLLEDIVFKFVSTSMSVRI